MPRVRALSFANAITLLLRCQAEKGGAVRLERGVGGVQYRKNLPGITGTGCACAPNGSTRCAGGSSLLLLKARKKSLETRRGIRRLLSVSEILCELPVLFV